MAKAVGVHHLELEPGVTAEDFERFGTEEVYPATVRQDLSVSLLKGERGERVAKYVVLFEMQSIAVRDRYFPASGGPSEAGRPLVGPWYEGFGTFATGLGKLTDYVVGKEVVQ
jgi:hypothetical protein